MNDDALLEASAERSSSAEHGHIGGFAGEHLSPAYPQRAPWGTAQRLRAWQAEALDLYFGLDGPAGASAMGDSLKDGHEPGELE